MFLLGAALLFCTSQDGENITLKQSIVMALRNNSDIQIARFEPLMEQETLLGSSGVFDDVLFATFQTDSTHFPATTFFSGATEVRQTTYDFALGDRRRFSNGMQVEASFRSQGTDTNSIFALINPAWQNSLGLSLTVPILKDAGTEANTALIQIQKHRQESSVDSFEIALVNSLHSVERAYYELLYSVDARDLAQEALRLAQKLEEDNARKVEQGLIPRIQLTEAKVQVAAKQQETIRSRLGFLNASDRLRRLIDPSSLRSSDIPFLPTDIPPSAMEEVQEKSLLEESLTLAFQARPDLRRATRMIKAAQVKRRKAEQDVLPKLDLRGRAALIGVDTTFQDSFAKLFRFDSYELLGGVTLEVTPENRDARHALARSEFEVRHAEASLRELESRIVLEVREAVRDVKTQQLTLKAADEQLTLARERYDAEDSRFRQGLTTTYFLLASQNDLNAAKLNQTRARIDLVLSRRNLLRATATLLQDYRIDVVHEVMPPE